MKIFLALIFKEIVIVSHNYVQISDNKFCSNLKIYVEIVDRNLFTPVNAWPSIHGYLRHS